MPGLARFQAQMACQTPTETENPFQVFASLAYTKRFRGTIPVANGVSEQSIIVIGTQGLTTITGIQITADKDISVTLGVAVSNVPIPLAAGYALQVAGTSLTGASISNASGSIAEVTYDVVGD